MKEGRRPFFAPDIRDTDEWMILRDYLDEEHRRFGWLSLPSGTAVEVITSDVRAINNPGGYFGNDWEGHVVIKVREYNARQIRRLSHLFEEHLHKVRRSDPSELLMAMDASGFLEKLEKEQRK